MIIKDKSKARAFNIMWWISLAITIIYVTISIIISMQSIEAPLIVLVATWLISVSLGTLFLFAVTYCVCLLIGKINLMRTNKMSKKKQ